MLPMKDVLLWTSDILPRCSILITFVMFFIQIASSNKIETNTIQHRTFKAQDVKVDLNCYSCDYMTDHDDCVNINKTRQLKLTKKCEGDDNFCVVKRFSYTMSDKNSTTSKKLWSLQRDCTDKCENGCIIIGERVKLYACSSCCNSDYCNTSNTGSKRNHKRVSIIASSVLSLIIVMALKQS